MITIHIVILILSNIGFFCLGGLFQLRRTQYWKFEWLTHEYDLARLQNRKPRTCKQFESENK